MQAVSRLLEALHIEHARQAPAVTRWERTRHDVHAAHGLVDERPEQTAHLKRVVDLNPVEQHEVLIGLAAAHVEAGGEVVACDDTRKQRGRPEDVAFAKGGNPANLGTGDAHDTWRRLVVEPRSFR